MRRLRPVAALAWALASVVLAAALFAGYRAAPGLSPFVLRSVRVEGAERTGVRAVLEAASLEIGAGLFSLDVDRIRRRVSDLPWVRRARVVRQLPSSLTVEVEEWTPRYLVRLERLSYLTAEGHVVVAPLDQGLDYPVITGITRGDLEGEGTLASSLRELLLALEGGRLGEEPGEIHADRSGFTVYTPSNGGTGIRLGLTRYEEKLTRLARLRRHLERRSQAAYAVDLNYEDKIIARLQPAGGKDPRP